MKTTMTLMECYVDAHGRITATNEQRQFLADFVGVNRARLRDWKKGKSLPLGERKLRLIIFLVYLGYSVEEFEKVPSQIQQVMELVALGVRSLSEVTRILGYKSEGSVLRLLFGQMVPTPECMKRSMALVRCLDTDIEGARTIDLVPMQGLYGWYDVSPILFNEKKNANKEEKRDTSRQCRQSVSGGTKSATSTEVIDLLALHVRAALPLVEHLFSDKCSDRERARLRECIPDDGLMLFSTLLNGLLSREARKSIKAQLKRRMQ